MGRINSFYDDRRSADRIGSGTMNSVFRMGQLESGIWVALREMRNSMWYGHAEPYIHAYESYCGLAEHYAREECRVPEFCIGVSSGEATALLVEDLTAGGEREIHLPSKSIWGTFQDTGERVYIDLDHYNTRPEEIRFMSEEARINL